MCQFVGLTSFKHHSESACHWTMQDLWGKVDMPVHAVSIWLKSIEVKFPEQLGLGLTYRDYAMQRHAKVCTNG